MLELTNSQQELVEKVRKWFHNWENGIRSGPHPQYITYTGRAGSGKTVVAQSIVKDLGLAKNEYVATAYVGKAVMRLQQTNLPAKTIHSLIYRIIPTMKLDEKTNRKYLSFSFELKESLDPNYRLIIVDEATMVNEELQKELLLKRNIFWKHGSEMLWSLKKLFPEQVLHPKLRKKFALMV